MRSKLVKITLAAGTVLAIALTLSCSDDKNDNNKGGGGTGKWCVFGGEEPRCVEIGTKYGGGQTMTEGNCKLQYNYSIRDEKPDCIVVQ